MKLRISEIAAAIGAPCPAWAGEMVVERYLTDSRSLTEPSGTLFFALTTRSGDGHRYVRELYRRGVRAFVVSEAVSAEELPGAVVLRVDDVLEALQGLASEVRNKLKGRVIAVTGSYGKTMVKEWIAALLPGRVYRSPRSYNSQTGVALSLLEADEEARVLIFEAGISRPGEMERLERMLRPDYGVLTGIGGEHDEGFASRREKIAEKLKLFRGVNMLCYCIDAEGVEPEVPCYTWSFTGNPQARVQARIEEGAVVVAGERFPVKLTDRGEKEDAVTAMIVSTLFGGNSQRVSELEPIDSRIDVVEGVNRCVVVHDTFTNDSSSLAGALDFLRRRADVSGGRRLTAILTDPCDGNYTAVARELKLHGIDRLIGIGEGFCSHREEMTLPEVTTYGTVSEMLSSVNSTGFVNELVLVKGTRRATAPIVEMLAARRQQTMLEVNLDALVRNYNYFKSLVRPETGIIAMVKAFGYGAGSYELAKTLQEHGADYLAVASHDEGAELRRAGITMPVMVLNPRVENYAALFDYGLEPEVYSAEMLSGLIESARSHGIKGYGVHLKLDTGMHRLGFVDEELDGVIAMLAGQENVEVRTVFSHLCAADDPLDDDYTRGQFRAFDRMCERLHQGLRKPFKRHILNTAGIVRFPEEQHDLVRPGIGLYGVDTLPGTGLGEHLEPVATLTSVIIALRRWTAGTTIGYNRRGVLERESVIATIPIGYADGIDRRLGYGNMRLDVGGYACPTVGSICMDVMMIDVTDVPNPAVGQRVEIFGRKVGVNLLARELGTIPYEVLTSVAHRVKRVYYRE